MVSQEAQEQSQEQDQEQLEGQEEHQGQDSQEQDQESAEESQSADAEPKEGEGQDGEEKPAESKPEDKHKRKGGYQRAIERLERQIAERNAMLAQVLQRLPQQPGGAEAAKPDPARQAAEQFHTLVQMGVQEALAAEKQSSARRELVEEWEKQMPEEEEDAYEVRGLIAKVHAFNPGPVKDALLTSKLLPKIMSELHRNPLELARISALPEARQAAEIGRLEERLSSGATPQNQKPGSAKRPPAPPSNVGGSAAKSTRSMEDLPIAEYKRAANARAKR